MIIGASSFASALPELQKEVESIELYIPKLRLYKGSRMLKERVDEIADFISTFDMLSTIHSPYYGDSPNYPRELMVDTTQMGKTQFRFMEESIDLASKFGSTVVVIHPGKIKGDRESSFNHMVSNLRKLVQIAENAGIIMGLENKEGTDPTNLCCTAEEHMQAIEKVNSSFLRTTLDIGHANLTCGGDQAMLGDFIKRLGDSIVHMHIHDNAGTISERYFGDMHGAPGEGIIDFGVLRELRFDGVYNLEVFSMNSVRKGKKMLSNLDQKTLNEYLA